MRQHTSYLERAQFAMGRGLGDRPVSVNRVHRADLSRPQSENAGVGLLDDVASHIGVPVAAAT
jgi:hypothetical protein